VSYVAEHDAVEAPPAARRRNAARTVLGWLPALATLAALVGLWWLLKLAFGWPKFIVPSPRDVAHALWVQRSYLPRQFWVTLLETLEGFGIAIGLGLPIAVCIAYSRLLERTIYPVLLAINAVPKIAIAPILVLWMGLGQGPKVAMVVLICFFPIVLSAATGLKSTPVDLTELVESLAASRVQAFLKVRFPAALPHVFVGLKVAISLAVIGAVIGEFVGASEGLGYVIIASGGNANTSLAFGAMVLLAVMSIALFYALVALERLVAPWARHVQS
jgi:NitT/TauT family transport system permease protein